MEFKIEHTRVYGLDKSFKASGNPMRTIIDDGEVTEKDKTRAFRLGVQLDITAPLYFWKQAQRYHWFDFVSSQSTMHCLLKFDIEKQCVKDTNKEIIDIMNRLVSEYNNMAEDDINKKSKWRELVASLPCGFCLGATMTTNYQQLKTMYLQRRYHKLDEWHVFCAWCESLPDFVELTGVKNL